MRGGTVLLQSQPLIINESTFEIIPYSTIKVMQYYLIALLISTPFISFACSGRLLSPENILPLLFVIPLTILFYVLLRLIPKTGAKGIRWALKRTFFMAIVLSLMMGYVAFQFASTSLCLTGEITAPLPLINEYNREGK